MELTCSSQRFNWIFITEPVFLQFKHWIHCQKQRIQHDHRNPKIEKKKRERISKILNRLRRRKTNHRFIFGFQSQNQQTESRSKNSEDSRSNLRIKHRWTSRLTSFLFKNNNESESMWIRREFEEFWFKNHETLKNPLKTMKIPRFTTSINCCKPMNPQAKLSRKRFEPKNRTKTIRNPWTRIPDLRWFS